jgi:hypothetical protein
MSAPPPLRASTAARFTANHRPSMANYQVDFGVHVRLTDKVTAKEAQGHGFEQYMQVRWGYCKMSSTRTGGFDWRRATVLKNLEGDAWERGSAIRLRR